MIETVTVKNLYKILYGISEEKSIDITEKIKNYFNHNDILDVNININELVGKDPYFSILKKMYIYNYDQMKPIIIEECECKLLSNLIIENKKNILIILSHNLGGGLSQYVRNIIDMNIGSNNYQSFDIYTNEKTDNNIVNYITDTNILNMIENMTDNKNIKVIVHINILPNFTEITNEDISKFIEIFIKKKFIKLIITVHDYFWLFPTVPSITGEPFDESDSENIVNCQNIFERANLVIFPTNFLIRKFQEKKINFEQINYIVQRHSDIYYIDTEPYFPVIENNIIKILYIGAYYEHKGFNLLIDVIKLLDQSSQTKIIELYLIGGDINYQLILSNIKIINLGTYENTNVFKLINKLRPTLLVLPSKFYETWSYTLSICLKTGLPLFYSNNAAYQERINKLNRKNVACFNPRDDINEIMKKLQNFVQLISENNIDCQYNYINVDEEYKIIPNIFYDKLYNFDNYDLKNYIKSVDDKLDKLYSDNKEIYDDIWGKIRLFAIYIPQFHKVEENDIIFEKYYTHFTNLRKINNNKNNNNNNYKNNNDRPLDIYLDYYDLILDDNIFERQIKIAKAHGLNGFMFYHYWFSKTTNKTRNKVMYKFIEKIFEKKEDYEFNFFFSWINEELNHTIQDYNDKNEWNLHINYLLKFFKHKNYLRISNRPVFMFHHEFLIDNSIFNDMISYWKRILIENGFEGIYIILLTDQNHINTGKNFQSTSYHLPVYRESEFILNEKENIKFFDYRNQIKIVENYNHTGDIIYTFFNNFDNSACLLKTNRTRFKCINSSIENMELSLDRMLNLYKKNPSKTKIFLINAWNEWGENMSIEPSNEYQFKYLEIIRNGMIKHFSKSTYIFSDIYKKNIWRYGSGEGSLETYTIPYRKFLVKFLIDYDIKTILDIGCGDWQFSKLIDWSNYDYTGIDCVQSVIDNNNSIYGKKNIKFLYCDILNDINKLKINYDLIILKDVIIHWPNEQIRIMLPLMKGKATYILLINTKEQIIDNADISLGDFRPLNYKMKPLNEFKLKLIYTFGTVGHMKEVLMLK